jgi:hypothetical protein
MIFHCVKHQTVELTIIDYEFSEPHGPDHEWLDIRVSVHATDQDWVAIDPALELGDYPSMINWFRALSQDKPVPY